MLQIRQGVFETNSSSTHSITICTEDEFEKWKNGETILKEYEGRFIDLPSEGFTDTQKQEVESHYRELYEQYHDGWCNWDAFDGYKKEDAYHEYYYEETATYEQFAEDEYLEYYEEHYITESGDNIVVFGKYGHD